MANNTMFDLTPAELEALKEASSEYDEMQTAQEAELNPVDEERDGDEGSQEEVEEEANEEEEPEEEPEEKAEGPTDTDKAVKSEKDKVNIAERISNFLPRDDTARVAKALEDAQGQMYHIVKQYEDGDISEEEYAAKREQLGNVITRGQAIIDAATQASNIEFRSDVKAYYRAHPAVTESHAVYHSFSGIFNLLMAEAEAKGGVIDHYSIMDSARKQVEETFNVDLSGESMRAKPQTQALDEAGAELGSGKKPVKVKKENLVRKAKEEDAKKRLANLPPDIGALPSADEAAESDRFANLDRLATSNPDGLIRAMERMKPHEIDEYMKYAGHLNRREALG